MSRSAVARASAGGATFETCLNGLPEEVISIHLTAGAKVGIAAAAFLGAAGVWYWRTVPERTQLSETKEALGDVIYRVRCSACDHEFEEPAASYVAKLGREGMPCVKCGAPKAWRVGEAGDDPAVFRDEIQAITTTDDLRISIRTAQADYDRLAAEFAALPEGADPARRAEMRRQLAGLRAKLQALHIRWDELADGGH
ncbi:MAG: hypothetical protein HUU22_03375 [Phycisphaerae bacterium]|nr:zinc ribbon domain-containing protein [Phycisphaerae bacterium]NUQ45057.1 hypothetical protein [Phycisphaerae bacterium]